LYNEWSGKVDFLVVYIMEAHADDEWPISTKLRIKQHKTIEDRQTAAACLRDQFRLQLPIALDSMQNEYHLEFAVWPERYHIIDGQGRVDQIGQPRDDGYSTARWPAEIRAWLKRKVAFSLE